MGRKLPEGWEFKDFEDIVEILDSKRKPINSSERNQRIGNIPYYGATGQAGTIDDYIFDEELVLLGEDGADFINKDKDVAYLISGKSWVNNHAHVLKGKNGLSNKWLCYFLNSIDYSNRVAGATRMKLNQAEMKKIKILFSPTEQQKIVSYLDKQFKFIDNMEEQINDYNNKLDKLEKGILEEAFGNKEKSSYKKLSEIATLIMGQSPDGNTYNNEGIGTPFFQGKKDFGYKYPTVRTYTTSPTKIAIKNDILMSVRAPVGDVNISNIECCIGRGLCAIRGNEKLDYYYIYWVMIYNKLNLLNKSSGSVFDSINKTDIENFEIYYPDINAQKSIAYKLDKQFELINSTRQEINNQIEKLKDLRKAMLNDIFGGFEE